MNAVGRSIASICDRHQNAEGMPVKTQNLWERGLPAKNDDA
jgi:hypothetical protein